MGSPTIKANHEDSAPRQEGPMQDRAGAGPNREIRLRRIRKRLVTEAVLRLLLMGLFLLAVSLTMGAASAPYRMSFAMYAMLFLVIPGLAIKWWNWNEARKAVSEMWAFGELNFKQVSKQ